ncbi:hypothetical protein SAMN05216236_11785 [Sedimentitalea nanhaiensis]|uniref:Uncharacterized protein n=1 Tax=Sedimentitalea nanhaiensis TaxID=999627 RepID=A0A1I7CL61_9RHOB|nr:hypothetical protein SAMN05216236_11785 [Sedimentitalea nanhaiensis]
MVFYLSPERELCRLCLLFLDMQTEFAYIAVIDS